MLNFLSLKPCASFSRLFCGLSLSFFFVTSIAYAERFPLIKNKAVLTECGTCHMAFPPQTLPKASWKKMMNTKSLANHFGEDLSGDLEPKVLQEILNYHVKNASDVSKSRAARKWRIRRGEVPQRLTKVYRFNRKHSRCKKAVWAHKKVRSKANCQACHPRITTTGSAHANVNFLPRKIRRGCEDN